MKYTAHEFIKLAMVVKPDSYTHTTAVDSDAVDTKGWREALWSVLLGDFQAGATFTAQLKECDEPAGSYANITGARWPASGTYDATAGGSKEFVGSVDLMQRQRYQKISYTVGTNSIEFAVAVVLLDGIELAGSQVRANVFRVGT